MSDVLNFQIPLQRGPEIEDLYDLCFYTSKTVFTTVCFKEEEPIL